MTYIVPDLPRILEEQVLRISDLLSDMSDVFLWSVRYVAGFSDYRSSIQTALAVPWLCTGILVSLALVYVVLLQILPWICTALLARILYKNMALRRWLFPSARSINPLRNFPQELRVEIWEYVWAETLCHWSAIDHRLSRIS